MSTPVLEAFFDGACPVCRREVAWIGRRDRQGRIRFTDISHPDFDAAAAGVPMAELMKAMHGRLPDGRMLQGVEVLRHLYNAIGFGPLVALSRLPGVSWLLDLLYAGWARNRYRLTGRCTPQSCPLPASPSSGPC